MSIRNVFVYKSFYTVSNFIKILFYREYFGLTVSMLSNEPWTPTPREKISVTFFGYNLLQ